MTDRLGAAFVRWAEMSADDGTADVGPVDAVRPADDAGSSPSVAPTHDIAAVPALVRRALPTRDDRDRLVTRQRDAGGRQWKLVRTLRRMVAGPPLRRHRLVDRARLLLALPAASRRDTGEPPAGS